MKIGAIVSAIGAQSQSHLLKTPNQDLQGRIHGGVLDLEGFLMQNKGNRYPGMEGKVKAMISKLWDLSQLHGTPSLHRPSGRMVAGSLAGSHASAWALSKARSSSKMPLLK